MNAFTILIEDDFELNGDGSGNVASHQYLPSLALMDIACKHGIKLTFMVDAAQHLVMKQYTKDLRIASQVHLWEENILMMIERGFDVQLHLHPQWLGAQFRENTFITTDNWNIGTYSSEDQRYLVQKSCELLRSLICPIKVDYALCAFKAGSWGLQPNFRSLLETLTEQGIKIILGPRAGLSAPSAGIDYTQMEEKYRPYRPRLDDVARVDAHAKHDAIVLPLQPYNPDWMTLAILGMDRMRQLLGRPGLNCSARHCSTTRGVRHLSPLHDKNILAPSLFPYRTHLKIGNLPFSYMKRSFDKVLKRIGKYAKTKPPIVIESHSKQLLGYLNDVDRFIGYIQERYVDKVEFLTLSEFAGSRFPI